MNNSAFTNSNLPAWLRTESSFHEENTTAPTPARHRAEPEPSTPTPQFSTATDSWLHTEPLADEHRVNPTPLSTELSTELGINLTDTPSHNQALVDPLNRDKPTHSPPATPPQAEAPTPEPTAPTPEPRPRRAAQTPHTQTPTRHIQPPQPAPQVKAEPAPQGTPQLAAQPVPQPVPPVAQTQVGPLRAAPLHEQPHERTQSTQRTTPARTEAVARHHAENPREHTPPAALDQTNLVNPVKPPPKSGWRKLIHDVTAGHINLGESAKQMRYDDLLNSIREPLRGDYRIAVMSLKGGVGKTTTTAALGGIFAETRGDRVIAIDANPDLGTLAQRITTNHTPTVRDLLNAPNTTRYPDVRSYTTQAKSRLEVIGSERDPAKSEAFSERDYRKVIDILQNHYNVILTDCGTGLTHSAMNGVLDLANSLVLATSPALDGAQSASATLDWLSHHGYQQLATNSVVVISSSAPGRATIDVDELVRYFRSRTRAVHVIPYDQHLAEGSTIELDRINRATRRAYLELAAIVAEDFNSWHRHAAH